MGKKQKAPRPSVVVLSTDERRDLSDSGSECAPRIAALATASELDRQAAVDASLMVKPLDVRLPSERTSVARARDILGRDAVGLSDAEVLEACRHAEMLAQLIVEMFLALRSQERSR